MWSDYNRDTHRVRYAKTLAKITSSDDVRALQSAMQNYVSAKTDFSTVNSDETMIHLIATWARVSRVIREMDEKYV
jgi:hypothetical protein